jgi:hypothetical protein
MRFNTARTCVNKPRLASAPGVLLGFLLAVCIHSGVSLDTVEGSLDWSESCQLEVDPSQGIDPGEGLVTSAIAIEIDGLSVAMYRAYVVEVPFSQPIRLSARSPPALS